MEKIFLVRDKTGRSHKPYKLDKISIEKFWDLSEEDWDSEQRLSDYLNESDIGDIWNTGTEKFQCISIN